MPGSSQTKIKRIFSSQEEKPVTKKFTNTLFPLVGAAAISGLPADIISYPFSRVKTIMMTQGAAKYTTMQLHGTKNAFKFIFRTEGFKGLYRGLSPVVFSAIPGTTLFFVGIQTTKNKLGDSGLGNALSGLSGQIAGSIVWVPSEVLKEVRQMTLSKPELQNMNVPGLTRYILRTEGIKGMYRGFIPQLFTFGPFNSLGLYLSSHLQKKMHENNQSNLLFSFFANYIGFGFSAAITTPIDVIKTRLQVGAGNPKLFSDHSIISCTKHIVKQQGITELFSGMGARMQWLSLRQGIAFTTFGEAYKALSFVFSEKEENDKNHSLPTRLSRN